MKLSMTVICNNFNKTQTVLFRKGHNDKQVDAYGRVNGILGATGLVAQRFFQRLQFHPWLEPTSCVGSPENRRNPYDECRWSLDEERPPPTDIIGGGLENISYLIEQFHSLGVRVFSQHYLMNQAGRWKNLSAAGFCCFSCTNTSLTTGCALIVRRCIKIRTFCRKNLVVLTGA